MNFRIGTSIALHKSEVHEKKISGGFQMCGFNPPPFGGPPRPMYGSLSLSNPIGSVNSFGEVRSITGQLLGKVDPLGNIGGIGDLGAQGGFRLNSYGQLKQGW